MAKHTILPKHRQFLLDPPTVALNFEVGRSPFVSATLETRAPQVGPPVCANFLAGNAERGSNLQIVEALCARLMRCYPVSHAAQSRGE